jgi:hypothetical protein
VKAKTLFSAVALGLMGFGCGNIDFPSPTTGCETGTAAINVYPNMLEIACGCAEPDGTTADLGTNLDCTVPAGTTVFWHYISFDDSDQSQIISEGTPSFSPSPVFRGGVANGHGVLFDTATQTYQYIDGFNSGVRGRIIVP